MGMQDASGALHAWASASVAPMQVLILGCGWLAGWLAKALIAQGIVVHATVRRDAQAARLAKEGIQAHLAPDPRALPDALLAKITHLLDSIPPDRAGHPPQADWAHALAMRMPHLQWLGYLSSTSVYGDHQGAWVDEDAPLYGHHQRAKARIEAERIWRAAYPATEIFRLAGLYGPDRSIAPRLLAGDYAAVRFVPPRWSNRIHLHDAIAALMAAMRRPHAARTVNLADDEPLPHAEYACELARLIGAPPPELISPEEAARRFGDHYLSFFLDNKRVANARLHQELLPQLRYASFRDAAGELAAAGASSSLRVCSRQKEA